MFFCEERFHVIHHSVQFSSVQSSCSVMSDFLWSHESQHARRPCPSLLPEFIQTHVHWVSDLLYPKEADHLNKNSECHIETLLLEKPLGFSPSSKTVIPNVLHFGSQGLPLIDPTLWFYFLKLSQPTLLFNSLGTRQWADTGAHLNHQIPPA